VVRAMSEDELQMIQALNDLRDLQAKKEKELGKQILEEQDKL